MAHPPTPPAGSSSRANGASEGAARPRGAAAPPEALGRWLAARRPILLDGALGTELERRGIRSALPLWSAHALLEAPHVVEAIHREYVAAGCMALTANTFRTQRRTLARAGLAHRAAELTGRAVALARAAARAGGGVHGRAPWVLGSAPPLEDCYRPDRAPGDRELVAEHREHAGHLAAAGVDGVLVETHHTIREAVAAVQAALAVGLPAAASFVCDRSGRLLSGEALAEAVARVQQAGAAAVGVNCVPPSALPACLAVLRRAARVPFGAWPNLGEPGPDPRAPRSEEHPPEGFARSLLPWSTAGAALLGGCCGTTPAHLRALAALLGPAAARAGN